MGDKTKIEWTDATWNPVTGCSKVSIGCQNCYGERTARRLQAMGQENYKNGFQVTEHKHMLGVPYRWKRTRRIFVCSMGDLFHEDVSFEFIAAVFGVMASCQQHQFFVLTKRPVRMFEWFRWVSAVYGKDHRGQLISIECDPITIIDLRIRDHINLPPRQLNECVSWPLKNVYLGVTSENQEMADKRIPFLLKCPSDRYFVSCEPLLGEVNLEKWLNFGGICGCDDFDFKNECCNENIIRCNEGTRRINCVIVGGESGPMARPMHPKWAIDLRRQCEDSNAGFFFKQWGEWMPIDQPFEQESPNELENNERWMNIDGGHGFHGDDVWRMRKVGKKKAGRLLDGVEYNDFL